MRRCEQTTTSMSSVATPIALRPFTTCSPCGITGVMTRTSLPQRASGFSATDGWQPVSNSTLPWAWRSSTHDTGASKVSLRSAVGSYIELRKRTRPPDKKCIVMLMFWTRPLL